ncbi:MAG: VOC family protein [Myxococcaceae bacterium]|nr:VOC family protein [Myxococcaceae bacterium]
MRTLGIHHVAIQVHDVEKVAAFYREVLALPERVRHRRDDGSLRSIWVEASADGAFFAIEQLEGGSRGALGHSLVALRIAREERAGWLARFEKLGVPIEKQTRWSVYVRDPEGNAIALSHHPHDPL